jgi:hypothetical protein
MLLKGRGPISRISRESVEAEVGRRQRLTQVGRRRGNWRRACHDGSLPSQAKLCPSRILNRSLRADNQPARKAGRLELGYPCKLGMDYDVEKGLYRSVDYDIT